jgi:hypothetical protein
MLSSSKLTPVVMMYIESHLPRSTTLVSPVTTGDVGSAGSLRHRGDLGLQRLSGQPLLE